MSSSKSKYDERFFDSTRGRIVLLVRQSARTVNDLASELDLTDNAVRAHLLSLERDRLVEAGGTIKGFRKPHILYKLTEEARHIFPTSYDSLLNRLLDVLKSKMPTASLNEVLDDVGKLIAGTPAPSPELDTQAKLDRALDTLAGLGGAATIDDSGENTVIRSDSCPFADAVAEHPEICKVAESMLTEIVGRPVHECCDRTALPKCRFAIDPPLVTADQ